MSTRAAQFLHIDAFPKFEQLLKTVVDILRYFSAFTVVTVGLYKLMPDCGPHVSEWPILTTFSNTFLTSVDMLSKAKLFVVVVLLQEL